MQLRQIYTFFKLYYEAWDQDKNNDRQCLNNWHNRLDETSGRQTMNDFIDYLICIQEDVDSLFYVFENHLNLYAS